MALANSSNQIQANTPSGLSLKALKEAIPDDCFQPALVTSLGYLLRDLVYAGILGYCAISFIHTIPNTWLQIVAWALYGFLQGCVGVGLWILAHECGHGAFSLHPRLNDMIGWIVHSTLLVPYFSWKITHARHHRFTGHMAKDTAFVPYTEAEYRARFPKIFAKMAELFEDTPLMTCISLLGHQIFGWPAYLVFSVSAGRSSAPVKMSKLTGESRSHLDPFSMLFTASQQWYIFLSDIGLGIMVYFLVYVAGQIGTKDILLLYFLPYLWVNHWIGATSFSSSLYEVNFELTQDIFSCHHISPPHSSQPSTLCGISVDIYQRRHSHC
jgi:omega-6 fatty acid desaturase (delta-12 desaturase)